MEMEADDLWKDLGGVWHREDPREPSLGGRCGSSARGLQSAVLAPLASDDSIWH